MAVPVVIRYTIVSLKRKKYNVYTVMDEVLECVLCECYTEETAKIIAMLMNRENDDFCIAKKVIR